MKRLALTSMLALTMAGCALTNPADQYGDHLGFEINHDELAKGSVATLVTLYPPAKTHLTLQQKVEDPFGTALLKRLRESGYGVEELVQKDESDKPAIPHGPDSSRPQPKPLKHEPPDLNALSLRYVLAPSGAGLYHLTIMIGDHSLSRPYLLANGRLVAAGAWIRKE